MTLQERLRQPERHQRSGDPREQPCRRKPIQWEGGKRKAKGGRPPAHLQCLLSRPILTTAFPKIIQCLHGWLSTTPYQSLHGQRYRGKLVEFGIQVFYFIPKAMRSKMSLRWRVGTFIGNAMSTNEAYVAASNGDVLRTRSIVRVVEPSR